MFNPSASRWSRAAARHPRGPGQRSRRWPAVVPQVPPPARLTVRLGRLPHLAPIFAALAAIAGEAARR